VGSNPADRMWFARFDPQGMPSWPTGLFRALGSALRWGAHHTGLPVVLFAAIVLVASWHFFRRTMRFAVEVALAAAALLAATRLGWIAW
jgi:hypothetical protein